MSETTEIAASSGGDDLSAVIGAAYDQSIVDPSPQQQADETPLARDARGRFTPHSSPSDSEKSADDIDQPTAEDGKQATVDNVAEPGIDAPQSWSEAERAEWSTLTSAVQQAVLRLEREMDQALHIRAEIEQAYNPIKKALAPYEQKHAMAGITGAEAVSRLLAAQEMLERDFVGALPHLIRQFGHDPAQIAQLWLASQNQPQGWQQSAQQPQQIYDPRVDDLLAQQQQARANEALTAIEAFAKDPSHPHFEAVRMQMGQLIAINPEMSLKDAYEKAIWADDTIRRQLIAEKFQQAEDARKKAASEATGKARRAAVSVRDAASGVSSISGSQSRGSVEDDLRAVMADMGY